jgi:hypothetical protein
MFSDVVGRKSGAYPMKDHRRYAIQLSLSYDDVLDQSNRRDWH